MTQRDMLDSFILILFRRKWSLIGAFAVLMAGVCFYTYIDYPLYRAPTLILVRTNPNQQLILFRDIATPGHPDFKVSPAKNLIEIAGSREIAREIVQKFGFDERARRRAEAPEGFRERSWWVIYQLLDLPIQVLELLRILDESEPNYEFRAIDQFLEDRLEVFRPHDTAIVKLIVWEEDSATAAEIANLLAERVIAKTVKLTQVEASNAYVFTRHQAEVARTELNRIEAIAAREKARKNLIGLDQQRQQLLSRVDRLQGILDLTNLEIAKRSSQLREANPEMAGLRSKVEEVRAQIEAVNQEIRSIPGREALLASLTRKTQQQEQLYTNLKTKLDELNVQQVNEVGEYDVGIIDRAYLPSNADTEWPEWSFTMLIAVPSALILALLYAALVDYFDETYTVAAPLERDLGIVVLGSVPQWSQKRRRPPMRSTYRRERGRR